MIDVTPCICVEKETEENDSIFYGMPVLKTNGHVYEAICPRCGRGGWSIPEAHSATGALKQWNKLQERVRELEKKGLFRYGE